MGYSKVYTIIAAGATSSHFWIKWMTTQDQIAGLQFYRFNDLDKSYYLSIIIPPFYCMLYEHIWILLNIFRSIINSCHILPPLLMFLCCLLASNQGHLFCDADTLLLGYWSLWSFAYILYIRYKYVLTYFWIIYANIFYWAGRTYVQYCVRKLNNVN